MLQKTRGIVLRTSEYSENSLIAKVYTEKQGLCSFLLNAARGARAKFRPALLQPLSPVEMVIYYKETRGMQRVSEMKACLPLTSIPFDINKISMALFLSEVLYKSVREEEENRTLFNFIYNSICILDSAGERYLNFHLAFLAQLTRYLGFYPADEYSELRTFFNIPEGRFQREQPVHPHFLAPPLSELWSTLMKTSYENSGSLNLQTSERRRLLSALLSYYGFHVSGFGNVRSHEVLEQVMN